MRIEIKFGGFEVKCGCENMSGDSIRDVSCDSTKMVKGEEKQDKKVKYDLNSPAVTTHLSITAEIINRLANNSNYCKSACVAVVAVFAAFTSNPEWNNANLNWIRLLVWGLPVLSLWILDSLFVFLKKNITEKQVQFVEDVVKDGNVLPFVLEATKSKDKFCGTIANMFNISTWLFYLVMLASMALDIWFGAKG